MRFGRLGALALLLGTGGCVTTPSPARPAPAARVDLALQALERGDLRQARRHLDAVPESDSTAPGRRAMLVRALVALDPRNPDRSPTRGAALAARYVATAPDPLDAAVGRFLYAVALDLGAPSPGAAAPARLSGPTLAGRLAELEQAVARLRSELARIQETLKP